MSEIEFPATAQPAGALLRTRATAKLVLADGTVFEGYGFGAATEAVGEVCFNTAMTGYQEILTDPSYAGQIVQITARSQRSIAGSRSTTFRASPASTRARSRPASARKACRTASWPTRRTANSTSRR